MKNQMTGCFAAGVFSDIRNPRFSEEEKMTAILTVLSATRFADVRREAMANVINWLIEKNFQDEKGA